MATMNISLPDAMKDFVEGRVATGLYGNSSDVIRDLIRHEQIKLEKIAAMQALVDEALAEGDSDQTFDDIIADARREAGLSESVGGV